MPHNNPYLKALSEPVNLVSLAGLAAASLAMLNPLPLLVGVVAEAGYLLFIPESRWYQDRLSGKKTSYSESVWKTRKAQVIGTIRPALQNRFNGLENLRGQIEDKIRAQVSFSPEIFDKLDQLLVQFLNFSASETEYRLHLQDLLNQIGLKNLQEIDMGLNHNVLTSPYLLNSNLETPYQSQSFNISGRSRQADRYASEYSQGQVKPKDGVETAVGLIQGYFNNQINKLDVNTETDPSLQQIKQKRADLLIRRNDHVGRMGKAIVNLDLQLQLIEDTFGLINDEATTRSSDGVLTEIDNLMMQTDSLNKSLQELSQIQPQL